MDGADNELADALFESVLGPDYWVPDAGISRRTWEILLLRKGCLDGRNWSLAECADRYGVSRERIRQIEKGGVKALLATIAPAAVFTSADLAEACRSAPAPIESTGAVGTPPPMFSERKARRLCFRPMRHVCLGGKTRAKRVVPSSAPLPPPTRRGTFERLRARLLALITSSGV